MIIFRNCEAYEIAADIAQVNKGGVRLLLFKKPLIAQKILDETFGVLGWSMKILEAREGFCKVLLRIYNTEIHEWVEREGISDKPTIEAGVNDALAFAASQFGIGAELYTGPELFVSKENLKQYEELNGEFFCKDRFAVGKIEYSGKVITSVEIMVKENSNSSPYYKYVFTNHAVSTPPTSAETSSTDAPQSSVSTNTAKERDTLEEDELILFGYQQGKMYKDVKDTPAFAKFLSWVATSTTTYNNAAKNEQLAVLKRMAAAKK